MIKKLAYSSILLVLGVSLGVFLGLTGKPAASGKASAGKENKVIKEVTQVFSGKVVKVDGKSLEVEDGGDRLTVVAAEKVFISDPEKPEKETSAAGEISSDGRVVGRHSPSSLEPSADFSAIQVGRTVIGQMVKDNITGQFVVRSLGYLK